MRKPWAVVVLVVLGVGGAALAASARHEPGARGKPVMRRSGQWTGTMTLRFDVLNASGAKLGLSQKEQQVHQTITMEQVGPQIALKFHVHSPFEVVRTVQATVSERQGPAGAVLDVVLQGPEHTSSVRDLINAAIPKL